MQVTCNNYSSKMVVLMKYLVLLNLIYVFAAHGKDIIVRAHNIEVIGHKENSNLLDFIPTVSLLEGKELQKERRTSLGDTLNSQVGINSTQFGPSASRPVIRGLDGDRIRILQNSLGTLDASTQSLDHAIPSDILTLDAIEVVRGPMSLIYGSSAVGGVVNLVTSKIHSEYSEGIQSSFLTQYESVNPGMSSGFTLDYGKNNLMMHLDGSSRNLADQENPNGKLENSFNQQDNFSGGITQHFTKGYLGVSYNLFNTFYGTVAEEDVSIKMEQKRFELHGEYSLVGDLFSKVRLRHASSDYVHRELEGAEVGTEFTNKGYETRVELINNTKELNGISGVQIQDSSFAADGDEAFLPSSRSQKIALFSYQELNQAKNTYSYGARIESSKVKKDSSDNFGESEDKDFVLYNGSLGFSHKLNRNYQIGTNLSYTERNANFQELYADGEHIATGTYENGDSSLEKEKAYAVEINLKNETVNQQSTLSIYSQQFENFIALNPTGSDDVGSGLPIYDYTAIHASFYGIDFLNQYKLGSYNKSSFNLNSKFDLVRAINKKTNESLSRISPPRLSFSLEMLRGSSTSDIEFQYVAKQDHTATNETETSSYSLVNLGYSYDILKSNIGLSLFVRARNIFDVKARNHVSILKEIAPLPGRNIISGIRAQF